VRRPKWEVATGDALEVLKRIPDKSVHMAVGSPPYWKVRRYSGKAPLGSEETPEEWAENVAAIYDEVYRILRDDGSNWLNIGDSWYGPSNFGGSGNGTDGVFNRKHRNMGKAAGRRSLPKHDYLKKGDLVDQPAILSIALMRRGWYRRHRLVWERTNPVPDSAKNRPAMVHEAVLLLTKEPSGYYYDHTAVREEAAVAGKDRNRRSVLHIPAIPSPVIDGVKHTSTFPPELARICIAAGSSERGVCPDCGAPQVRRLSKPKGGSTGKSWHPHEGDDVNGNCKKTSSKDYVPAKTLGWKPSCKCPNRASPVPALVVDPFSGLGTSGEVCLTWGRDYFGAEKDPKIAAASRTRLRTFEEQNAMPLFAGQAELFGEEV